MRVLMAEARSRGACADGFCGAAEKLDVTALLTMVAGGVGVLVLVRLVNMAIGIG